VARRQLAPKVREQALSLLRLPAGERPFLRVIAEQVGVNVETVKRWAKAE